MKYAVEVGSVAMIYVPSFIKIGSGIQKLLGRGINTQRQWGSHVLKILVGKWEIILYTLCYVFRFYMPGTMEETAVKSSSIIRTLKSDLFSFIQENVSSQVLYGCKQ
jgi:hypothetical protein